MNVPNYFPKVFWSEPGRPVKGEISSIQKNHAATGVRAKTRAS